MWLDRAWAAYAAAMLRRPWLPLLALCVLVAVFGMRLDDLKFDASSDSFVLEGDQDLKYARASSLRYGNRDFLLVVWRPRQGDLLDDENLARLSTLRERLAAVAGVESVVSILDVPLLSSTGASLADLGSGNLTTLRSPDVDRSRAREEFLNSPVYQNLLVSADGQSTMLQVNLTHDIRYQELLQRRESLRERQRAQGLGGADALQLEKAEAEFREHVYRMTEMRSALVAALRKILQVSRSDARLHLGGVAMIVADAIDFVKRDLSMFGVVILVLMVVALSVAFRGAWRWVPLPLINCAATAIAVIGLFAWMGWSFSVMSANFFALLLILTLSISMHLVVRYRELHAERPWREQNDLVADTARFMLRPCLFMTLTTLVAFASLVVSGIRPVIDFGWMMTIGVSVSFVFAFLLLPAMMQLFPKESESRLSPPERAITHRLAVVADRHRRRILMVAAALALFSVTGIFQLEVENRFIDYFDEDTEIYRGMETIDRELGGTIPLEVVLRAPPPAPDVDDGSDFEEDEDDFDDFDDSEAVPVSAWFNRAGLERIASVHDYLESLDGTGKVLSLATMHRLAQQLLNGDVSDVELAVMQHGLSEGLSKVLIEPYLFDTERETRLTVRVMETSHSLRRDVLLKQIRSHLVDELEFEPEDVRLTGLLVLYNNMLQSLYTSQILTLGAVFVAIMLMLTVLFRSWRVALVGIAPSVLAACSVLAIMGWFGIPLDMMTTTTAAIVVGIGVDNNIHYLYRFRHELTHSDDDDYIQAMYRCHGSIGRAMYYTSATVVLGMASLTLSNFTPSVLFGMLTSAAMLLALLGALLLLPPLLFLFRPFGNPAIARANAMLES